MASSKPTAETAVEEAGSQGYADRHFAKIFEEGFSFSGYERDKVWLGGPDGTFFDASGVSGADSVTDGRGAVFGDFDNDGDTDIFLHTIQGPRHLLFRNNVGQLSRHLRLVLEGTLSNRDGVGALIKVTSNGRTEARTISAGGGYLSTHDRRPLFGLGDEASAERVEVRWPSGTVQVFQDVPAGQTLRIREDSPEPTPERVARFRLPDPAPEPSSVTLVAEGDRFPRMVLPDTGGNRVDLASYRDGGRWTLVNFWATWCVPCRKEMPHLQEVSRRYSDRMAVVGVSLDVDEPAAVTAFLESLGTTYPVLIADETSPLMVFREDDVRIPSSFLVDPSGMIRGVFTGGDDRMIEELDRALAKNLARSPSS